MNNPNALLYKWLILNSFAWLLVYAAWLQGWIHLTIASDASYLSVVMGVVFVVFWFVSSYNIYALNREVVRFAGGDAHGVAADYFDKLRRKSANMAGGAFDQSMLASTLRARLIMPVQAVNYVANILVLLGLIGTVVGFVIAVAGLGDSLSGGTNIERVQGVLGQIVNGMGTALFTTVVGSILGGLWLQIHYIMLARTVNGLVIELVEQAEIEIIPGLMRRAGAVDVAKAAE